MNNSVRRSGRFVPAAVVGTVATVALLAAAVDNGGNQGAGGSTSSAPSQPRVASSSSPVTAPAVDDSVQAPGAQLQIPEGKVVANDKAGALSVPLDEALVRTLDGAVAAFTSQATWLIGSPAARAEPSAAVHDVAASSLSNADAQVLTGMQRSAKDSFTPSLGAYRVLGHSGSKAKPDHVMVEVLAPLTTKTGTRWVIIGGVVSWNGAEWKLASMAPRELPSQPPVTDVAVGDLPAADRQGVLDGLGWVSFGSTD